MSNDNRHLTPWWRRRYWPWACGVVGVMFAALASIALAWPLDWHMTEDDRGYVLLKGGTLTAIVNDDQYVQRSRDLIREYNGHAHAGILWTLPFPTHPFALPRVAWSAEDRGSLDSGAPGPVFGHTSAIELPLGWPTLLFTGLSAFGFYRLWKHRHPPGHCQCCGYDMAGLAPGSSCPECGRSS